MSDLLNTINEISEENIFLVSEISDITKNGSLIILTPSLRISIHLPSNLKEFKELIGSLSIALSNKVIVGWKLKSFFSFCMLKTGRFLNFNSNFYDLQVLEFLNGQQKLEVPTSYFDAISRLKITFANKNIINLYNQIYLPLLTEVLPKIETTGLVSLKTKKKLFCNYDLIGHLNNRLTCNKLNSNFFNPHSMSYDERDDLKPPFFEKEFLYFDYKNMEVSVLQWLSGDLKLKELLESDKDLYSCIWELLTGIESTDVYRKKCKEIFLPVIYGQGYKSVAEKLGIVESTAEKLVNKIYSEFKIACDWVKNKQNSIDNNAVEDFYGRKRIFTEELYKVRSYSVASPAALICLDHLVKLFNGIKSKPVTFGYHVHDGYVLFAERKEWHSIIPYIKNLLEGEIALAPGLKLKVVCHVGKNLNKLELI